MEIQLQELIEQIKKDGVEAAENQAEAILLSAKAEAEKIIADAQAQADKLTKECDELGDSATFYKLQEKNLAIANARSALMNIVKIVGGFLMTNDLDNAAKILLGSTR